MSQSVDQKLVYMDETYIQESLTLSDAFDLNEILSIKLLVLGEFFTDSEILIKIFLKKFQKLFIAFKNVLKHRCYISIIKQPTAFSSTCNSGLPRPHSRTYRCLSIL